MARSNAAEQQNDNAPQQEEHTGPVLVLVTRAGPYRVVYTRPASPESELVQRAGRTAVEPITVQLPPGLGMVPAEHWPRVSAQERWRKRVAASQVQVIAGATETLAQGWARTDQRDAVAWIEKSGDVRTLETLRDLEEASSRPRRDVQDAITDALERVKAAREKMQQVRATQRRAHRSRAW